MPNLTTNDAISKRLKLFFQNSGVWSDVATNEDTCLVKARKLIQVFDEDFAVIVKVYPEDGEDKWAVVSLLYKKEGNEYVGCSKSGFRVEKNYNLILSYLCNSLEKTLKSYKSSRTKPS